MTDVLKRIRGCMSIERAAVEMYKTFSNMFPDEKDLFADIMQDELNHIAFLDRMEQHAEEFDAYFPPNATLIKQTMGFVLTISEQITYGPLTLQEAILKALRLEESMVELFANVVMARTNEALAGDFGRIMAEETKHVDKLKGLMLRKGYLKVS